jgi:flagellin
MASLLTNASAMTALSVLASTNKAMDVTQSRIATGQRVATAADNASYWSIATTMRADKASLSAVQDALGLGASVVDTASTALSRAIEITKEIQALYTARAADGADTAKIDAEITQKRAEVVSVAVNANFNGTNLLATAGADADVVVGYDRAGTGVQTMTVAAYDMEADIATATDLDTTEIVLANMQAAAADLGAASKRIDGTKQFTAALMDSIDRGIGQLVDADMNAESTRLKALQTQQQLGIQALSIANSNSQNILQLFR